jgi:predicted ArsR family transcriptional regulator
MSVDTAADIRPAPKRTAARTRRGPSTAARVAALKDKHPDMPVADIAARLKVCDRTVRRHLATTADTPQAIAA